MIETEEYKVPASTYGRSIGSKILSKWWWIIALPMLALLIASFWNWRWIVAMLALLLVLYPGVLLIGYYYYALSPEMAKAILPQRAVLQPEGIRIVYCCESHELSDTLLPISDIKHSKISGKYFEIALVHGFEYKIPISAFSGTEIPKYYNFVENIDTNYT